MVTAVCSVVGTVSTYVRSQVSTGRTHYWIYLLSMSD
uniref:Uncharacterized protein n=1 Tax=Anguilla anguilla TaxID=7936 RepID=A0A0E9XG79_ANGAN